MKNTLQTYNKTARDGVSLIEVVIGAAILSMVIFSSYLFINQVQKVANRTTSIIRANYLLLESVDVVRILRDNGWATEINNLSLDTPYYLIWDSGAWVATTTISIIDGKFYRTVAFGQVLRDASDNISTSGSVDTGTRKVTATVGWFERTGTSTRSFETYITNLYQD